MTRKLPDSARIYPKAVTSSSIVEFVNLGQASNLRHDTRLPGGFAVLSMVLPMTIDRYWEWRENRRFFRIVYEQALKTLFEGQLEEISIIDQGRYEVLFRGYWSVFTYSSVKGVTAGVADYFGTGLAPGKDYNTTADLIISDMLSNGFHADNTVLSTSTTKISTPGVTIDQTYPDEFTLWECITDATRGILTFPDTSDNKVDLAVWDDKDSSGNPLVHLTSRNPTAVTWRTFLNAPRQRGVVRYPLRLSERSIANAVTTQYSSTTLTGMSTDYLASEELRRERVVKDIGTTVQAAAEERRDLELALHKDPQQEVDDIVIDRVWDANGIEFPLCRVRAGDVLQVADFLPKSANIGGVDLDARNTFVIEETSCRHGTGQLIIRPDREGTNLADILIKNKIT